MPIGAERDRLEREFCANPLHNDLVVNIVEDDILVEANTCEEELVKRAEGDASNAGLVPTGKLNCLFLNCGIV